MLRLILIGVFATIVAPALAADDAYGSYSGPVDAEWLKDGRHMRLLKDVSYRDPNGLVWRAPAGSVVDGASIPQIGWTLVGGPFTGEYRDASVIHDIACQKKERTWEVVHLAFYYAMRASGVSQLRAKIMYAAVYFFGPRWPVRQRVEYALRGPAQQCQTNPDGSKACVSLDSGGHFTSGNGDDGTAIFTFEVPPPPRTLSEDRFDELKAEIEKAEGSSNPMGLEDIAAFR